MQRRAAIHPLTSLRFVAAFAVVIFHYDRKLEIFPLWVANFGYQAVSFFFVLSGFILTYAHCEPSKGGCTLNVSTRTFFLGRFARISPAYWLGLALSLPFFLHSLGHQPDAVERGLLSFVLVPAMLQAWWPPAALAWNAPAWSIANELFFYALFPFLLPRISSATAAIILAYALVVVASIIQVICIGSNEMFWHHFGAYFPLLNAPQFIFGAALGVVFLKSRDRSTTFHATIFWLGVVGIMLAAMAQSTHEIFGSSAVLVPIFGLAIVGAARLPEVLEWSLSGRAFVLLGEASYAVYILHSPVWLLWHRVNKVYLQTELSAEVDFSIYVGLVVAASIAAYLLLERPLRRVILSLSREKAAG